MTESPNLRNIVYDNLVESIVRGEYHANDIINERAVAEKFGCSKAPVREALGSLCTEGILRNLPRFGYEVVAISEADISDVLRFRRLVECGLLKNTLSDITPKKIDLLSGLVEEGKKDMAMWDHWDANTAFHLKLASFSGNGYAYKQLREALSYLKFAYGQYYWDKWSDGYTAGKINFHERIVDALVEKDLEAAQENLAYDIQEFYY